MAEINWKSPWVIGGGVLLGLVLLSRTSSTSSGASANQQLALSLRAISSQDNASYLRYRSAVDVAQIAANTGIAQSQIASQSVHDASINALTGQFIGLMNANANRATAVAGKAFDSQTALGLRSLDLAQAGMVTSINAVTQRKALDVQVKIADIQAGVARKMIDAQSSSMDLGNILGLIGSMSHDAMSAPGGLVSGFGGMMGGGNSSSGAPVQNGGGGGGSSPLTSAAATGALGNIFSGILGGGGGAAAGGASSGLAADAALAAFAV